MKSAFPSRNFGAFSLIELLVVIAIVGLLAALLLPALVQAKARALRIQCNHHLHEIGVGFVGFANDHNGKFPMALSAGAGGALEMPQSGQILPADFDLSVRPFQALSNELVTPRLVVCPADTRVAATSFAALTARNLSYFVGLNADFSRPTSILAGDRNLTNDYATPGSLLALSPNSTLRWTRELHQFKGNLLFSDGHTEEKTSRGLLAVAGQLTTAANLAVPGLGPSSRGISAPAWPVQPQLPGAATSLQPLGTGGKTLGGRAISLEMPLLLPMAVLGGLELTSVQVNAQPVLTTNNPTTTNAFQSAVGETNVASADTPDTSSPAPVHHFGSWWLLLLVLLVLLALAGRTLLRAKSSAATQSPTQLQE